MPTIHPAVGILLIYGAAITLVPIWAQCKGMAVVVEQLIAIERE